MLHEVDKETFDFMCSKQLSFNQYMLCLFVYHKDGKNIIRYSHEVGLLGTALIERNGERVMEIDDLINRGFIETTGIGAEKYAIDNFLLTPKFTKGFLLLAPEDAAEELHNEYPSFVRIGQDGTARAKVWDYDEFCETYIKIIGASEKEHKIVMNALRKFKRTNEYAEMNLKNFVKGRHWKELIKEDGENKSTGRYE